MMNKQEYLWLRLGDMDGYECYSDIENVAQVLDGVIRQPQSMIQIDCGIVYPPGGFDDANYISLFWGDDENQPERVRDLTPEEFEQLRGEVATLRAELDKFVEQRKARNNG